MRSKIRGSISRPTTATVRRIAAASIPREIAIQAMFVPVMRINRSARNTAATWKARERRDDEKDRKVHAYLF